MKKLYGFLLTFGFLSGMQMLLGMEMSPSTPQIEENEDLAVAKAQVAYDRLHTNFNFTWIDEDLSEAVSPFIYPRVAGMKLPTNQSAIHDLVTVGVRLIVSLTETPLPSAWVGYDSGLTGYLHLPVNDKPTIEQIALFIRAAEAVIAQGGSVAVHCEQGIVRTGFLLACWLVIARNQEPKFAFYRVKQRRNSFSGMVSKPLADDVRQILNDPTKDFNQKVRKIFEDMKKHATIAQTPLTPVDPEK